MADKTDSREDCHGQKLTWAEEWLQKQKIENPIPHLAFKRSSVNRRSEDLGRAFGKIDDDAGGNKVPSRTSRSGVVGDKGK